MASVRALHEEEGWDINAGALADPKAGPKAKPMSAN
jgi:hypothetical protein